MSEVKEKQVWEDYCAHELEAAAPVLKKYGFELEVTQPHLAGERYLMQAVTTTSGKKLVLLGHRTEDGKKVIIKITRDKEGAREIEHEQKCREALKRIDFAYQVFFSPEELLFTKDAGFVISIQVFLESRLPFLNRSTEEQFSLALKAFKAQESAHATTYKHLRFARSVFGSKEVGDYLSMFDTFTRGVSRTFGEYGGLGDLLASGNLFLHNNKKAIEQYSGFLTHTDFVPHNFRVMNNDIYLLDHASIRFGNKYEGWARFVNFMVLYNQRLAEALLQYVHDNRAEEERLSLRLMRVYRLGEIIYYYRKTLQKSSGDLLQLNTVRVNFWAKVLESVLKEKQVPTATIASYIRTRDTLRSESEKNRQIGLH